MKSIPGASLLGFTVSLAVALTGCGEDTTPADAAGIYTLNVTNSVNECMLQGWMEGQQSTGAVTLTVTQLMDRRQVNATVTGAGGLVDLLFVAIYGSNNFTGTITGRDLAMQVVGGGRTQTIGACTFSPHARVAARLEGDTLTGTLYHQYTTNNVPDCGYRNQCTNSQMFNGTRPVK